MSEICSSCFLLTSVTSMLPFSPRQSAKPQRKLQNQSLPRILQSLKLTLLNLRHLP